MFLAYVSHGAVELLGTLFCFISVVSGYSEVTLLRILTLYAIYILIKSHYVLESCCSIIKELVSKGHQNYYVTSCMSIYGSGGQHNSFLSFGLN